MFSCVQVWRVPGTFIFVPEAGNLVCAAVLVTFGRVRRRTIFHKNCIRPGLDHVSHDHSTSFCRTSKNPQNSSVPTVQGRLDCEARHFPFRFRNAYSARACPWLSRKIFLQCRPQAAGPTAFYLSKLHRSNDAYSNGWPSFFIQIHSVVPKSDMKGK